MVVTIIIFTVANVLLKVPASISFPVIVEHNTADKHLKFIAHTNRVLINHLESIEMQF